MSQEVWRDSAGSVSSTWYPGSSAVAPSDIWLGFVNSILRGGVIANDVTTMQLADGLLAGWKDRFIVWHKPGAVSEPQDHL